MWFESVDYVYSDKRVENKKYENLLNELLENNKLDKEVLVYKGEHMVKMVSKIVRSFKKKKIKLSHKEVSNIDCEYVGIEIADMWAGYINHKLKIDITDKNINIVYSYLGIFLVGK